jgi:hypothetical protein
MDFINPEEKTREAKLDYGETESLVRFLNFQRERRGEPPISTDYGQLCELLSGIHPEVEFKLDGHRIVARVKDGAAGSLVDRIGFVSSQIPYLAATIGFGSDSFEVVFRADGIGVIKEDSWYEFFEHDLKLEEVRCECENDRDTINDFLQDHFNEHIGPEMEDPFFDPSGEDCELYFESGSRDELERLMKLFILTEPDIEACEDEEVRLYAAIQTEPLLRLIVCDADVHQVQDLSGREGANLLRGFEFKGGGGTDFKPAIAEAAKWKPDLLIYLTDLEGDAGAEPTFPVLWAVPEGKAAAPWGKIVELSRFR